MITDLINKDRQGFLDLCKRCQVGSLYAFGSSTRDDFRDDSDVDVLVDVKPLDDLEAGGALLDLWDGLEAFFQRPVDLLTRGSLRNPYLIAEIERTKMLIYDGRSEEVLV
ncbi:MAG: nucleotidyltransferase domain-containing protein [Flavobacteriales bacterium]|nr:nucleotidyltransferase domain-containing protein [Flavobacteriales bacterium]